MGFEAGEGSYSRTAIGGVDMKKNYADMDPLEEIRAIREKINRQFKTASALSEYLRATPPKSDSKKQNRRGRGLVTNTDFK